MIAQLPEGIQRLQTENKTDRNNQYRSVLMTDPGKLLHYKV